jgi:hypothetical protein
MERMPARQQARSQSVFEKQSTTKLHMRSTGISAKMTLFTGSPPFLRDNRCTIYFRFENRRIMMKTDEHENRQSTKTDGA